MPECGCAAEKTRTRRRQKSPFGRTSLERVRDYESCILRGLTPSGVGAIRVRPGVATAMFFSVGLVLAAAFPWGDIGGHPHWSRVVWVPFVSRRVRPLDVAGNFLLCAPLGVVAGLQFRRGVMIAGLSALSLSVFVEAMQLFSHDRYPSGTDVVCNVAGACVSALVARRWVR